MWISCSSGLLPALQRAQGQRHKPWQTRIHCLVLSKPQTFQGFGLGRGHPEEGREGNCWDRGPPSCPGWGGDGCPTQLQALAMDRGPHPSGGTAGPPHGAAAVLQSSWAAKPARKASVAEVLHISPCCSQFESSQSGSLPELQLCFGASEGRGRAVLQAAPGWGGGCGVLTSSLEGSPTPGHGPRGSQEWASAGGSGQAGNCKSFSVRRWAPAQACFLFPAKASAVLHTPLPPSLQHFRLWKCLMWSPPAQLPLVGFSVV